MVTAAIAKARDMNVGMSIAVVDAGGHLLAFNRIEDSMWLAAHAAQGKAVATSALGWASADIPSDNPVIQGIFASLGGLMVPAQGATHRYPFAVTGFSLVLSAAVERPQRRTRFVPRPVWLRCRHRPPVGPQMAQLARVNGTRKCW